MEHGVLKFKLDAFGKPIVPNAHSCIKESGRWWSIYAPPVDRRMKLLCYLWEEHVGLYAVFAESADWKFIDPMNERVSLSEYYESHDDWLSFKFDGIIEVRPRQSMNRGIGTGDELVQHINVEGYNIRLPAKPGVVPSPDNQMELDGGIATKLYPCVHGTIGLGDRSKEVF